MQKKTTILLCVLVLIFFCSGASCFGACLSPAFSVISHDLEIDICGLVGNPISFSNDFFKNELGTKLLGTLRISSLPDESFGTLTHDGGNLSLGDTVSSHSLNKIKFFPKTNTPQSGNFVLSVSSCGINYDITCNLHILDRLNFAPCNNSADNTITTFSGVCTYGQLYGSDPENDEIVFEISTHPKKGLVTLVDSRKGRYVYSPYKGAVGEDCFEYTVKDKYGNRSSAAAVSITLTDIDSKDVYSDLNFSPSAYGATLLSELDIFRGERIGGKLVFSPEKNLCLEDFLMMSMSYGGYAPSNDYLSSQQPYTDTAKKLGFINESDMLDGTSIITTAQGAQIVEKITNSQKIEDEFVFSPIESPYESLERLVMTYPALFSLEGIPNSTLSRASAVSLVVACIPHNG